MKYTSASVLVPGTIGTGGSVILLQKDLTANLTIAAQAAANVTVALEYVTVKEGVETVTSIAKGTAAVPAQAAKAVAVKLSNDFEYSQSTDQDHPVFTDLLTERIDYTMKYTQNI